MDEKKGEGREQALLPLCLSSFADSEKCPFEKSKRKRGEKKFLSEKKLNFLCENKALIFSIYSIGGQHQNPC